MALIKNAELHYARVIPNRPNKKYNKDNPTWEVQIRTEDVKQKKEWEGQGLRMKAVVPEDGGKPYWKTTLRKKIRKADGEPSTPVEVKKGDLSDCDPAIIGNGSRGDVRVYQYEYDSDNGKSIANVLMGIKLTKLKKYTPKARDDEFEESEMEVEEADEDEEQEESSDDGEDEEVEEQAPAKPKPTVKPKSKFD